MDFFRETLRVVAAKHKVLQSDILGPRRYREFVYARQELVWLLRQARDRTGKHRFSYPTIARWIGQDHTTLIHGYKAHEKRMGAGK
jgi:chromosomal replication initiation ATPase DnaA